jgi:hypothetical protein
MLRLARGYDDKADRVLERAAHLTPDFYKRISRMGNEVRSRKLPPERRSEPARVAAEARWRQNREVTPDRHLKPIC